MWHNLSSAVVPNCTLILCVSHVDPPRPLYTESQMAQPRFVDIAHRLVHRKSGKLYFDWLSYAISYSKFYRNPSGWLSHTSTWSKCEMIVIVVLWILFLWSSPEIVKNVNPFPYKTTSYKVPNDSLTFLPLQQFFYLLPLPCGMWQSGGWNLAECSHVMVTCLWPCIG